MKTWLVGHIEVNTYIRQFLDCMYLMFISAQLDGNGTTFALRRPAEKDANANDRS
jgi:hypothetical protein